MIKVIDNFIPEDEWNQIKAIVMLPHNAFPWAFAPETIQEPLLKVDPLDGYQFVHTPYTIMSCNDNPNIPPKTNIPIFEPRSFKLFLPIINNPKLNCKVLIKMKLNLNPRRSTVMEHGFHVDNDLPKAKTAVFYFNDNNGYTKFEKTGEKVYSKENRIVIFDNNLKHTGTTCTDTNRRVVMNINFYEDLSTPQSKHLEQIFKGGYHEQFT